MAAQLLYERTYLFCSHERLAFACFIFFSADATEQTIFTSKQNGQSCGSRIASISNFLRNNYSVLVKEKKKKKKGDVMFVILESIFFY